METAHLISELLAGVAVGWGACSLTVSDDIEGNGLRMVSAVALFVLAGVVFMFTHG